MKKLLLSALFLTSIMGYSQVFKGKGDQKLDVDLNLQNRATGISATFDYGIADNLSIGVQSTYAIGLSDAYSDANFGRRFDARARFNANIGNVLNISDDLDLYAGVNVGLHNFGGQIGARYFFTDGFGVNLEMVNPLARYDSHVHGYRHLNNQFQANIGVSFNL